MARMPAEYLPLMRQQGLLIDEIPDEVLVYDRERDQAHCLNKAAALVWQACDGKTTPGEISRRLAKRLQSPCSEELVWLAITDLKKRNLLEPMALPPKLPGMSRREVVRALGFASVVALPLITTIVAPTPADAATCSPLGQSCVTKPCCVGSTCNGSLCI